jgi:hypothetical protein
MNTGRLIFVAVNTLIWVIGKATDSSTNQIATWQGEWERAYEEETSGA